MTVASISFLTFIVAGLTSSLPIALNAGISLVFGIAALFVTLILIKKNVMKKAGEAKNAPNA